MGRRLLAVVGTRAEAVKMAPVIRALAATPGLSCRVLATAQHRELLDGVLATFGIVPDRDLDVMRPDQSLGELTARLLPALERALEDERPDLVLAQGDTTTVMATALAAFYRRVPFAHVEAGLRTGRLDRPFPEEANRAIVARLAAVHLAPTEHARSNLLREGVPAEHVHVVGNPVVDALLATLPRADAAKFAPAAGRRLVFVTTHRREHFGAPLERLCRGLAAIADRPDVELLLPLHPNPNVAPAVRAALGAHPWVRLAPPLGYEDTVAAMAAAALILTDSGGIQEEAPSLGVPVLVLREETERPEGIAAGVARLVGTDAAVIAREAARLLDDPAAHAAMATAANPYGDGRSAGRIAAILAALPLSPGSPGSSG
ncbi:MAG: UDP-N-acetylglucosamine 2-epimerase (non-hydrolyzing) [Planctomycetes bacterium]|nr:UDP-N-acetylglucosamine 2-epimerase (non-hydrolyzing) [Planctomycetota bacterium]